MTVALLRGGSWSSACAALLVILVSTGALAQNRTGNPLGSFGSGGGGPIKVDAGKLEVFDRENRAVYSGDVVAVRGKTTLRGSKMTIFYSRENNGASTAGAAPAAGGAAAQAGAIRRIEVEGPVSVACEQQYATAARMVYDALGKKITLTGNAVVGDGPSNVLRGEEIVYDTEKQIATAKGAGPAPRIQSVIEQGQTNKAQGTSTKSGC